MTYQPDMTPCELQVMATYHCPVCHEDIDAVGPTTLFAALAARQVLIAHHNVRHPDIDAVDFVGVGVQTILKEVS